MDKILTTVFCGTPSFAVPSLEKLVQAGMEVRLVVTQPDRPKGRGLEAAASPVKQKAEELGLLVVQPEKIKAKEEFRARLEAIKPDAIIVVGYGRIIPQWMIDLPPLGNINVHASLLPKYRGAAPIQWAIANGETVTGVTTMRIDAGLDTGDILMQKEVAITQEDTSETLGPGLATAGADLLIETLNGLQAGIVRPRPQDHADATIAPVLTKEDGRIDFAWTATKIFNRLRAFQPWPGAYTSFRGRNLNIWRAKPARGTLQPGELLVESGHLLAGCREGSALDLLELQPEGKKRMPAADFINGYRPQPEEKLGA